MENQSKLWGTESTLEYTTMEIRCQRYSQNNIERAILRRFQ